MFIIIFDRNLFRLHSIFIKLSIASANWLCWSKAELFSLTTQTRLIKMIKVRGMRRSQKRAIIFPDFAKICVADAKLKIVFCCIVRVKDIFNMNVCCLLNACSTSSRKKTKKFDNDRDDFSACFIRTRFLRKFPIFRDFSWQRPLQLIFFSWPTIKHLS